MRVRFAIAASGLAAVLGAVGDATAGPSDEKAACVAAHENAQSLRQAGKLRAARAEYAACARDACPAVVRKECTQAATEVAASQPTVVIEARDAQGRDTAEVRVLVDGTVVADRLAGRAIEVDPGEHVFRFEMADGAFVEERVVVREGQRNRAIAADFSKTAAAASAVASATATPTPPPTASATPTASASATPTSTSTARPGPSPLAYGLGAVGVAGIGAFTYFGLTGKAKQADLEKCAPACKRDDVDAMRRDYLIADVSLGVGAVCLGAAAWLWFGRPRANAAARPTWIGLAPAPGGVVAGAAGAF